MKTLKKVFGVSIILGIIFWILLSIELSNDERHNKMIYDKYQTQLDSLQHKKELMLLDIEYLKIIGYEDYNLSKIDREMEIELADIEIRYNYKMEMINNPYEFSIPFLMITILFGFSLLSLFLMFMRYLFFNKWVD